MTGNSWERSKPTATIMVSVWKTQIMGVDHHYQGNTYSYPLMISLSLFSICPKFFPVFNLAMLHVSVYKQSYLQFASNEKWGLRSGVQTSSFCSPGNYTNLYDNQSFHSGLRSSSTKEVTFNTAQKLVQLPREQTVIDSNTVKARLTPIQSNLIFFNRPFPIFLHDISHADAAL